MNILFIDSSSQIVPILQKEICPNLIKPKYREIDRDIGPTEYTV